MQTHKRVIMSKQIAKAYLDKVGSSASTITVYFQSESQLERFSSQMTQKYGSTVTATRGFDHVTFLIKDREVAGQLIATAYKQQLTVSGF